LSQVPSPFCFGYFWDRVLCAWSGLDPNPPNFAGWHWVLPTFCLGWPWNVIFPVSASWVARITDLSHYTSQCKHYFKVINRERSWWGESKTKNLVDNFSSNWLLVSWILLQFSTPSVQVTS
jgi:hypothetical protein